MKHTLAMTAVVTAAMAAGPAGAAETAAQAYPTKPIRVVLPVAPGGGVDAVGRLVGQELTNAWKQQVIIDHRPGAGGNISAEIVAKSSPDGYTLLLATASHAINPSLYKSLTYDPIKDFAGISKLSVQPYIFVVPASLPVKDVKEFVALAKGKKGALTYASVGAGLLSHLSMELLKSIADFDAVHVPYKGAAPAFIDVLSGRVDAFFPTMTSGLPHVKSGRLRAIGVTSAKRSSHLPEVPTVAEQGYPGYEVISWYALLAPAGTPRPVVRALSTEVVRILKSPDVGARMSAAGADPDSSTPEELMAYIKLEMSRWAKVIQKAGITGE